MTPEITIVTPTFNRWSSLHRLLKALASETYPAARFEVVVVDDGSTDGTLARLRSLSLPYALTVVEQTHQGPGAARNLGVERARGQLILFLDDDVVPLPGLLEAHARAHDATSHVVVIGPMSPPGDWPRPAWIRWEEEKLQVQYRDMLAGRYRCTVRQFYTGNASLTRAQFLEAGGFDPRFQRAEDVELGYRLRNLGATFVFEPRAAVQHFASRSFEAWSRTPYQYGQYDVIMEREKGHETVQLAIRDFHRRHPLNRMAARAIVGHRRLLGAVVFGVSAMVHVADRLGRHGPALAALSATFNLLYWQGFCDEFGGRELLWRSLPAREGTVHRRLSPGQPRE